MPAKRRTLKLRSHRITPAAIEAYRTGDESALHVALGLKPWEPSPINAEGERPWPRGTAGAENWERARELRLELESEAWPERQ